MAAKTPSLTDDQLLSIYQCLLQYLKSGIDIRKAIGMAAQDTGLSPALQARLRSVEHAVAKGGSLAKAMQRHMPSADTHWLILAEHTGYFEAVFNHLYQRKSQYRHTKQTIRTHCVLPNIVFVLLAFITPIKSWVVGDISLATYLSLAAKPIVLLILIIAISRWVLSIIQRQSLPAWMEDSLLAITSFRVLIGANAMLAFRLCYGHGGDLQRSLPLVKPMLYGKNKLALFDSNTTALSRGKMRLTQVISASGLFDDHTLTDIRTAEHSGMLDSRLDALSMRLSERLNQDLDSARTWAPRFYYVLLLGLLSLSFGV